MINGYNVHYYLGNKSEFPYKLWIAAHDADEAEKLCVIQAGHRHGYSYKITVTSIEDEAGKAIAKPIEQDAPEIDRGALVASIIEANKAIAKELNALTKRNKKRLFGGLF